MLVGPSTLLRRLCLVLPAKRIATHRIMSLAPEHIMSPPSFNVRPSEQRGGGDHGWLKTLHTFSFAHYRDAGHESYGPLRVINEDRVLPGEGFGTHSHREFEIFSYVVSGSLEQDSMGNIEILKRGDVQLTSAGTGISHSEKTYGNETVHFLQIWSIPAKPRLAPKYYTRHFTDDEKLNQWVRVVAPIWDREVRSNREDTGSAPVQSALSLYASILAPGARLERRLLGDKGYVHVIQTSGFNTGKATGATVRFSAREVGSEADSAHAEKAEVELREGDGAYLATNADRSSLVVENVGDSIAEFLVFDLDITKEREKSDSPTTHP